MEDSILINYLKYRLQNENLNFDLIYSAYNYINNKIKKNKNQIEQFNIDAEIIEYIIGESKGNNTSDYKTIADNAYESFLYNNYDFKPEISIYDPVITKFSNLVSFLKNINTPIAYYKPEISLINDLFQTIFNQLSAFTILISSKLYPSALASWRSLHESECIIKVLIQNEKIKKEYIKHIKYNNYLRNPSAYTKEELDKHFEILKEEMHIHDLKSKDMKKFIEYGYLYFTNNYKSDDTNFKLNFRDGLEYLADLNKYSKVYEGASQVVHSSSSYFYVNENFCKDLSLTLTYQTLIRVTNLYKTYMNNYFKNNVEKSNQLNKLLDLVKNISKSLDEKINIDGVLNDEATF